MHLARNSGLVVLWIALTAATCSSPIYDKVAYFHGTGARTLSRSLIVVPGQERARAANERTLHQIDANWNISGLSLSPSGDYLALALYKSAGSLPDGEAHLLLFDLNSARTGWDHGNSQLKQMVDLGTIKAAMHIDRLGWLNDEELSVDLQPQTRHETPSDNIWMVIDAASGERTRSGSYSRTDPSPLTPLEPATSIFDHQLIDRVLHINGQPVQDLRTGIRSYLIYR